MKDQEVIESYVKELLLFISNSQNHNHEFITIMKEKPLVSVRRNPNDTYVSPSFSFFIPFFMPFFNSFLIYFRSKIRKKTTDLYFPKVQHFESLFLDELVFPEEFYLSDDVCLVSLKKLGLNHALKPDDLVKLATLISNTNDNVESKIERSKTLLQYIDSNKISKELFAQIIELPWVPLVFQ